MLVRKIRCHCSVVTSSIESPQSCHAALLTSTSRWPNCSTVRSTSAWQCSSRPMSPARLVPPRPASRTRRTVSVASSSSMPPRYEIATSAPSRAKAIATALPMPESPPVMSATLSAMHPEPSYDSAPWSACGFSSASVPGGSCCCFGKGGVGYCVRGSCCSVSVVTVLLLAWSSSRSESTPRARLLDQVERDLRQRAAPTQRHGQRQLVAQDLDDAANPVGAIDGQAPQYRTSHRHQIGAKSQPLQR